MFYYAYKKVDTERSCDPYAGLNRYALRANDAGCKRRAPTTALHGSWTRYAWSRSEHRGSGSGASVCLLWCLPSNPTPTEAPQNKASQNNAARKINNKAFHANALCKGQSSEKLCLQGQRCTATNAVRISCWLWCGMWRTNFSAENTAQKMEIWPGADCWHKTSEMQSFREAAGDN